MFIHDQSSSNAWHVFELQIIANLSDKSYKDDKFQPRESMIVLVVKLKTNSRQGADISLYTTVVTPPS